jgi:hypothetical protein
MIHIAPWEATLGLFRNAARVLKPGGSLTLYGPFFLADVPTAPSNLAFDESLRGRNPQWGVRDGDAVSHVAEACGFYRGKMVAMPANNFMMVFFRS